MPIVAKRMTFRLHQPTVESIDELVKGGLAPSKAALIERLVEQALRRYQQQQREAEAFRQYQAAFGDPCYRIEQDAIAEDFARADAEAAAQIV
ncbi:MAG TPA: ribbon-helix-helix protein, CopG family [Verrucomicrobiae bacterium]|nr:ribbon-helix-helix protein, CopG family [Verrucomicrobiae bacterium]